MMLMVMSSSDISFSSDIKLNESSKKEFFKPVVEKLTERGVATEFIDKIIEYENTEFSDRFVKINVTGYLNKADYSSHYNKTSVNKTKQFLKSNINLLELAEIKYNVPKEVIASVLWVETRHGSYLGNSHVASVYLSTAMCSEPQYIEMNIKNLHDKFKGSKDELAQLETRIYERSEKKSNWAIDQLVALEKIEKISPVHPLDLKGSWAGAFGISQFIPTSYVSWAVDGDGDGEINLYHLPDAIFSVANYLKSNGWGISEEEMRAAVFHYNNSSAYVDAVLKLADFITDKPPQSENQGSLPYLERHDRATAGNE
ncbi:MAG: lytic murein transglycosylase [Candidatus Kapabacteria bacterium]|nr:lytic murein transglycosylase [Ignavibacteriota bacterium]MCW5884229.1 lytic murein transglycosylase [Candidatus Kapabacteria bacterium]